MTDGEEKEMDDGQNKGDSDDDGEESSLNLSKKARASALAAEKSELAAFLSTPSTYTQSPIQANVNGSGSAAPVHVPISHSEQSARNEIESILNKIKRYQKGLMDERSHQAKEIDALKTTVKKLRKESDELMKNQQTNLATMGRKLR